MTTVHVDDRSLKADSQSVLGLHLSLSVSRQLSSSTHTREAV